ncbi:peptidase associated/transthyretin-like domain-containing protein [Wolbachia endosymbiont of Litomosoides sigmodontis]|uniref:hypothetical protein n=1 Tax=Wolbachia endosymbiont of Litomosoides sigmodontis TaxID=80850 RepID=UPI001FE5BA77|nr:hypothetical protein [Wolbachia endosymbiont of Litomosoides sigmodontis]
MTLISLIWHTNSRDVSHYSGDIKGNQLDPNFARSGRFIVSNLLIALFSYNNQPIKGYTFNII